MCRGKGVEALKKLVEQVPSGGAKDVAARDKAVALALRAMNPVRQSAAIEDASKVVRGSADADAGDADEVVVLLKYVYKAMEVEETTDVLAVVLLWHERLLACGSNATRSATWASLSASYATAIASDHLEKLPTHTVKPIV